MAIWEVILASREGSWRIILASQKQSRKRTRTRSLQGGDHHDFGGGIWDPKSTKIDPQKHPKIDAIFKRAKIALGEALGPSWGDLGAQRGAVLGAPEAKNEFFAWESRKKLRIVIFDSDGASGRALKPLRAVLGAQEPQKDPPRGTQDGPEIDQNRNPKTIEILSP